MVGSVVDFVLKLVFQKVFEKNELHALSIFRNQSSKTTAPLVNLVDNASEQQRAWELLVNCCEREQCTFSTDEKRGSS